MGWQANKLNSGSLTRLMAHQVGISREGCPHRGGLKCLSCDYAVACAVECEYQCRLCQWREVCPCGWESLERRREIYQVFLIDQALAEREFVDESAYRA